MPNPQTRNPSNNRYSRNEQQNALDSRRAHTLDRFAVTHVVCRHNKRALRKSPANFKRALRKTRSDSFERFDVSHRVVCGCHKRAREQRKSPEKEP